MPESQSASSYPSQKKLFYKTVYEAIPLDSNKRVDVWLKYFTGSGRKHMKTYLERSSRYIPIMKSRFKRKQYAQKI